jgi:hypothetical protein
MTPAGPARRASVTGIRPARPPARPPEARSPEARRLEARSSARPPRPCRSRVAQEARGPIAAGATAPGRISQSAASPPGRQLTAHRRRVRTAGSLAASLVRQRTRRCQAMKTTTGSAISAKAGRRRHHRLVRPRLSQWAGASPRTPNSVRPLLRCVPCAARPDPRIRAARARARTHRRPRLMTTASRCTHQPTGHRRVRRVAALASQALMTMVGRCIQPATLHCRPCRRRASVRSGSTITRLRCIRSVICHCLVRRPVCLGQATMVSRCIRSAT